MRRQARMAAAVALYEKWKKKTKIGIVRRPSFRYLYRWQMLTNSQTKWSKLNCQSELPTSILPFFACCVRSYSLICMYFLIDKWANVPFKSVFKRFKNLTTIDAFSETQKFISTSKGFSSRLEKKNSALILLYHLSIIWNISQNANLVTTSNIYRHSDNAALRVPNEFPYSDDTSLGRPQS